MGNCVFMGSGEAGRRSALVRVATSNGGVLELFPPVTAECVTNGFPGHAIYRTCGPHASPLLHNEELLGGELYYLRPVNGAPVGLASSVLPSAPYRVSFGQHGVWRKQDSDMAPPSASTTSCGAMWKVKLVICPAQLAEIMSQESRTEALIESVRAVAKCGNGSAGSSLAGSDQWSLASSRKTASTIMD